MYSNNSVIWDIYIYIYIYIYILIYIYNFIYTYNFVIVCLFIEITITYDMYLDHPAPVPNAWYERIFLGFKQKTHKAFTLKSQVLDVAGCTTKKKEIPQKFFSWY